MDESSFEIDSTQVAETSRMFPAHRKVAAVAAPVVDVSFLAAPAAEFGRHAWDEGGHF